MNRKMNEANMVSGRVRAIAEKNNLRPRSGRGAPYRWEGRIRPQIAGSLQDLLNSTSPDHPLRRDLTRQLNYPEFDLPESYRFFAGRPPVLAYYCSDEDQAVVSVAHTDVVLVHLADPEAYLNEIEAITESLVAS